MKQIILLQAVFLLVFNSLSGQNSDQYKLNIKSAEQLYQTKSYAASAQKYADAFAANGNKALKSDRYNAACSMALAGSTEAAFEQLFKIAREDNYIEFDHLIVDADLDKLHNDPRWEQLKAEVKKNKEKAEASLDKPLVAKLDTIFRDDQQSRMKLKPTTEQYGENSNELKSLKRRISELDSINVIKVARILDERGWLGADVIGQQGNTTLFLVIQHANLDVQLKYLPMMRDAVQKGNAQASGLALLEDRIALRQGKRQIYGSQIGKDPDTGANYVAPLEDPDNVDKRRAQVGLGPIAEYVLKYNITWDVETYKKQLPEIEAKRKN